MDAVWDPGCPSPSFPRTSSQDSAPARGCVQGPSDRASAPRAVQAGSLGAGHAWSWWRLYSGHSDRRAGLDLLCRAGGMASLEMTQISPEDLPWHLRDTWLGGRPPGSSSSGPSPPQLAAGRWPWALALAWSSPRLRPRCLGPLRGLLCPLRPTLASAVPTAASSWCLSLALPHSRLAVGFHSGVNLQKGGSPGQALHGRGVSRWRDVSEPATARTGAFLCPRWGHGAGQNKTPGRSCSPGQLCAG